MAGARACASSSVVEAAVGVGRVQLGAIRVDRHRLVEEGLVGRTSSVADGRGVVIAVTNTGMARLEEAMPVHLAGVSRLFLERLDDHELEVLEHALDKVSLHCSFG